MIRYFRQLATAVFLFSLLYLVFPGRVYAYLDPGTGSYILQLAIAALLGGSVMIKIYWKKIRTYLANLFSKKQKDDV